MQSARLTQTGRHWRIEYGDGDTIEIRADDGLEIQSGVHLLFGPPEMFTG